MHWFKLLVRSQLLFSSRLFQSKMSGVVKCIAPASAAAEISDSCEAVEKSIQHSEPTDANSSTINKEVSQNLSKRALKRMKRLELKKQKSEAGEKSSGGIQRLDKQPKVSGGDAESEVISEADLHETEYCFEGGLRKVYPYYFKFTAHAKGRWFGHKLVDIFTNEFRDFSVESCLDAVKSGRITVNGKPTSLEYVIKNGDFITNSVHRHELPVTGEPLEIVVDDQDVVVVNKPSSIPIHPCGRYRHNSVIYILAKEHGYRNLRGIYRLDRLTSGVLIFCKTEEKTREMMQLIKDRKVKKEYVCRVDGKFPSEPIECIEPIDVLSHKLGVYRCGSNGKESKTSFELMSSDGRTSVVKCQPHTGRTHQIRVHLQFLGFPISNDPVYNGEVWGPERGKSGNFGKSDEELISELERKHTYKNHLDLITDDSGQNPLSDACSVDGSDDVDENLPTKRIKVDDGEVDKGQHPVSSYDPKCRECQLRFRDPSPDQLVMYLHALRYQGPGWCYSTRLPAWAEADWKGS